ncbi:MAG: hypothetical protein JWQ71_3979 [Pedosphaera sp.]|nr:hypothetical protein [Pedosphaera sp.]
MENSGHPQSAPTPADHGVEASDIGTKVILMWLGVVVILAIIIHLVLWWQLTYFKRTKDLADQEARRQQVVAGVTRSGQVFPEPRLQVSPPLDLKELRAQERAELNSYGWVDKKSGVVRIPIDKAMEMIAQKGLPTRQGTNQSRGGPSFLELQLSRPEQYRRSQDE